MKYSFVLWSWRVEVSILQRLEFWFPFKVKLFWLNDKPISVLVKRETTGRHRLAQFYCVFLWERNKKKKQGHPGEMTVLFIVSENSRLQPAPPTTPPLNNSRPIGALLYPCASAVTPLSEVSYTPFGTAETHQCPSLKQENSLIFGPWLPIHVFFLYKSYTMLHFSSEYNSTD